MPSSLRRRQRALRTRHGRTPPPPRMLTAALARARALAATPTDMDAAMSALRRAKQQLHLTLAIADLARAWPLERVTGALTDFAESSRQAAFTTVAYAATRAGQLVMASPDGPNGPVPGATFIAMGKMGAGELNYSSDIDFSVFFDADLLAQNGAREPRVAAVRLVPSAGVKAGE